MISEGEMVLVSALVPSVAFVVAAVSKDNPLSMGAIETFFRGFSEMLKLGALYGIFSTTKAVAKMLKQMQQSNERCAEKLSYIERRIMHQNFSDAEVFRQIVSASEEWDPSRSVPWLSNHVSYFFSL